MDNPTTEAKVELGRLLFWDPILSGNNDVACATCHHPQFGYADGLPLSIGVGGRGVGPQRQGATRAGRNAPTVLLTGLNGWIDEDVFPRPEDAPMFWDIRAHSLEEQALGPIANAEEMRGDAYPADEAVDVVVARLAGIPEYVDLFADAFGVDPDEAVTADHLAGAIAAFERHLSRPSSDFDRWLAGDDAAMSAQQIRGFNTFRRVGCDRCHSGPMFSDYRLRRIGAPNNTGNAGDNGDGGFRFRTASLRNITRTAPYMHGGTFANLTQVFAFYRRPGTQPPRGQGVLPANIGPLDRDVLGLRFNGQDEADMAAFLAALTDEDVDTARPVAVPSGLPVGGR
ncbi:MAG: cytochrome C peroxidase [Myxococcales bacterium]|nr:cytochrome C peroxidase [Myxococcales bacterium]